MDSWYLYYTLGQTPIQIYIFSFSNCSQICHWELFLSVPFVNNFVIPLEMLLRFLNIFWALFFSTPYKDALSSFSIFPVPILESSIFPWSLYSFYYRMVLTNLDLYTNCAHWYWRVFGSGDLFLDRAKNYMCTSYPVFVYISRNILDGNDFMDMIPKTEAKKKENR